MKKVLKYLPFCLIAFLGFVTFYFYYQRNVTELRPISDYQEVFSGIVTDISIRSGGSISVTFNNGEYFHLSQFYLSDTVKNEQLYLKEWDQNSLNIFLHSGDSIYKPYDSDTIFLYRKGIEYIFIDRSPD